MQISFRTLSRQLTSILCCCFFIVAVTGIILGISDRFIELPNLVTRLLIAVHQGAFIGAKLSPIYVLLMGLGVFILGLKTALQDGYNVLFQLTNPSLIKICWVTGLVLIIPLTLCVETGVAYRLGTDWFEMSKKQTGWFLSIHSGASLGVFLGVVYTLATGLGLIVIAGVIWKKVNTKTFSNKNLQGTLISHFKQTYLRNEAVSTQTNVNSRKLIIGAVFLGLIIFLGVLGYLTSILWVAIAISLIVVVSVGMILGKKSIRDVQHQQKTIGMYEQETESITMLRAIPDSMLRMSEDGICLSYMPAKEAKYFVLYGDIINKHVTEFLSPEIATRLLKAAQLSLQTGITESIQFPILVDGAAKYHEARVTAIGDSEVLILIREMNDYASIIAEQFAVVEDFEELQLLSELELVQKLEDTRDDTQSDCQVLICLAIDKPEIDSQDSEIDSDLLHQIATHIDTPFTSNPIFQVEDNLVMLVCDRTMEQAVNLVDELHQDLHRFVSNSESDTIAAIKIRIGLVEVNYDNSDVADLIKAVKATCQMAKQKVNFQTFW